MKARRKAVTPEVRKAVGKALSRLLFVENRELGAAISKKGPHGILEPPAGPVVQPKDVRAWLVPGLAFTRQGGRLGYGGGWYDRFLCQVPKRVPKIGVAYAFQLVDELPAEPHDIRLTSVESCEDLADLKPLIVPPEEAEQKPSFWTLKTGPDSRIADAANARLAARPYTWGVGIRPSDDCSGGDNLLLYRFPSRSAAHQTSETLEIAFWLRLVIR